MLINCPRCGFSQPKDQYCASCGVNIETYVPRKTSVVQKMMTSTLAQVFCVVAIALGVSYYAMKVKDASRPQISHRKNIQQSASNSSFSATVQNNRLDTTSADAVEGTTQKTAVSIELQNEEQRSRLAGSVAVSATTSATPPSMNAPTGSSPTTTTASAVAASTQSVNIKVSYYEVSRPILAYWMQNGRAASDSDGTYNAGVINRQLFDDRIRYAALKTESTKANLNLKTNFKSDANKDGIMVGLSSEILISNIATNRINGNIIITKTTTQGSDRIHSYIDIPAEGIFFLQWKTDLVGLENEAALAEVPPFQILKSRQFLDQKTELVMIIETLN